MKDCLARVLPASCQRLVTSSYEQLLAVTENIGARYQEASGAKFVGSILKVRISQRNTKEPKTCLYERPSYGWVSCLAKKAANGLLNKIALAPEHEGVEDFVRTITGEGVTVALGHSNATLMKLKKQSTLEQCLGTCLQWDAWVDSPWARYGGSHVWVTHILMQSWSVTVTT